MKTLLSLTVWFSASLASAQNIDSVEAKKLEFRKIISLYNDSIRRADNTIKEIRINKLKGNWSLKTVIKYQTYVAEETFGGSKTLGYLYPGDSVTLYSVKDGRYLAAGKGLTGYIGASSVPQTDDIKAYFEMMQKNEKERMQKLRDSVWREHRKVQAKKDSTDIANFKQATNTYQSTPLQSGRESQTRTIHTGPRGGRYYVNSKGKKVYVKD